MKTYRSIEPPPDLRPGPSHSRVESRSESLVSVCPSMKTYRSIEPPPDLRPGPSPSRERKRSLVAEEERRTRAGPQSAGESSAGQSELSLSLCGSETGLWFKICFPV
ncbi:hypothetical protein EYF80_058390 [Liparis tanakae]|uniref:Uncharacterized protein n=1 Tax=Liparis tanakae TaxID=230148 RepID=A0A4Z2ERC6_9TELE|nr:hypothetical protein EYF80_058390 [Liparis tanakae]